MTTRAGLTGLVTGFISTLIVYPFFIAESGAFLGDTGAGFLWLPAALLFLLLLGGGFTAAHRSGSTHRWRCAVLGGLAGGLAGCVLFCLWGAAAAGYAHWLSPSDITSHSQGGILSLLIRQTMGAFVILFLCGSLAGALGGWLACIGKSARPDVFDKIEPQMAMNASITAVGASVFAVMLAAGVFNRLSGLLENPIGQNGLPRSIVEWPVLVSLWLVILSQFALTLVVPHETRQAEHRCGTDEVKMAAFVSIATAPVSILALLFIDRVCLHNPLIVAALLVSSVMSLVSVYLLISKVLPKRAFFAVSKEDKKRTEAIWFGSIASSYGHRLVILCAGCGLVMMLPMYCTVISVLIDLRFVQSNLAFSQSVQPIPWDLFITQALFSIGIILAAITALSLMYLFYLNLGRWFSRRNSSHSNGQISTPLTFFI